VHPCCSSDPSPGVVDMTLSYQGDEQWRRQRTADPLRDWPALHAASVRHPESFWSALFEREFRLKFVVPPRVIVDRSANLGAGAWLPGARPLSLLLHRQDGALGVLAEAPYNQLAGCRDHQQHSGQQETTRESDVLELRLQALW
jgi:hypothetical protein